MAVEAVQTRELLQRSRQETIERRRELIAVRESVVEAATDVATDDEHDPEGATIAYERSKLSTLITQADEQLADIQAALDRLDADTYGSCERCGEQVAEARLEALPATRTCLRCASARTGR